MLFILIVNQGRKPKPKQKYMGRGERLAQTKREFGVTNSKLMGFLLSVQKSQKIGK